MPVVSEAGGIELMLCPAASPAPEMHGSDHHDQDEDKAAGKSGSGDCAFAPLNAGLNVWGAVGSAPRDVILELHLSSQVSEHLPRGPPAPPPPPTGPPAPA